MNKKLVLHILASIAWCVSFSAFSKDVASYLRSETELKQAFASNGAISFDKDDTEYKSVLATVIDKWVTEKNAAFKEDSLLATYWLGKHELINGSKEKALQIFGELYGRTRKSELIGERAYALGAYLVQLRHQNTSQPDAKALIADLKSEFGMEAGKLSLLLKEIDIFELGFLNKQDDTTTQSLLPTAAPRYYSEHLVPIAMVNRVDSDFVQMFEAEAARDPIVLELVVLKRIAIADKAWTMNNDVAKAVLLIEKAINTYRDNKSWRVQLQVNQLVMNYAGVTCGGDRIPEQVQKAKRYLADLKQRLPSYQGKFLRIAEAAYAFGDQQCSRG